MKFWKLLRPLNGIMASFAVLVGYWIETRALSQNLAFAMVSVFSIASFGFLVNDIFDLDVDRINKPEKARYVERNVWRIKIAASFLVSFGLVLSSLINLWALALATFNSLLLYYYSKEIKRKFVFVGNIAISYLCASTFLFGAISSGKVSISLFFFLCSFLASISREVVKDLEDLRGDRAKKRTLPQEIGIWKSLLVANSFLFLSIALAWIPIAFFHLSELYILFLSLCTIIFFVSSFFSLKHRYGASQKAMKVAMIVGLIAFLLAKR